jgi:hypothetical protein
MLIRQKTNEPKASNKYHEPFLSDEANSDARQLNKGSSGLGFAA